MFLHILVWQTLRLLHSLALLIFVCVTRTLCGSTGQVAYGKVRLLECLETRVKLLGPFSNEDSGTLRLLAVPPCEC